MTSARATLESAYARTLLPLAKMWRQAADRALRDMNVSASTGWALVQVGRLGDDVRQTDLAQQLDVTQASLVRSIDQMTAAGLVERRRDPADARVSRIRLTEHGRALVTTIEAKFASLRAAMLDDVSHDDLATALHVAERLGARFMADRAR
ncbi:MULTISPECIES: MarR family transcriptional regulator [unclassified Sphingomonas]|uniref:MarR family winged helix-turn-helix transcriptional regulator n=1 Tax=unclassified Sphingomonas TaxID=196159 RepID=UPI000FEE2F72|nr:MULTISPECIES: MarR family transcriptional regulator [unclassified Sphingomonas]RKE44650.1 MarR family transcriptional regulator for hemolysin [Sphingomonas sp. PP-CC-1A-547]TCM06281.1 MarR family transcriptional regulator for hemolysin [Sphingomonas sp. PP-CC-3G-468]